MTPPGVLVIANDAATLRLYASLIAANGYRVTTATSAAAAHRALEERGEPFDLAIVDLPESADAPTLTAALRADPRFGVAPIVGVTVPPRDGGARWPAGCDAYLHRSFELADLQQLLVDLLSRTAPAASTADPTTSGERG